MKSTTERRPPVPRIEAQFERSHRQHDPGDTLSVRYCIDGCEGERITAVEHAVAWYTEGKGEEDLVVHFFERITDRDSLPPRAAVGTFATRLPRSPLSYEGIIVKIRWCVRIRIFFEGGRDFVSEHVFSVGRVPPAGMPASSA